MDRFTSKSNVTGVFRHVRRGLRSLISRGTIRQGLTRTVPVTGLSGPRPRTIESQTLPDQREYHDRRARIEAKHQRASWSRSPRASRETSAETNRPKEMKWIERHIFWPMKRFT